MPRSVYLDSSIVLRATLEAGTNPELERKLGDTEVLVTSRLSLVECARALARAIETARITELQRADAQGRIQALWARCHVWEITRAICERAMSVAPGTGLRTLDAIHLATFLESRRRLGADVELLTADERLRGALAAR